MCKIIKTTHPSYKIICFKKFQNGKVFFWGTAKRQKKWFYGTPKKALSHFGTFVIRAQKLRTGILLKVAENKVTANFNESKSAFCLYSGQATCQAPPGHQKV